MKKLPESITKLLDSTATAKAAAAPVKGYCNHKIVVETIVEDSRYFECLHCGLQFFEPN